MDNRDRRETSVFIAILSGLMMMLCFLFLNYSGPGYSLLELMSSIFPSRFGRDNSEIDNDHVQGEEKDIANGSEQDSNSSETSDSPGSNEEERRDSATTEGVESGIENSLQDERSNSVRVDKYEVSKGVIDLLCANINHNVHLRWSSNTDVNRCQLHVSSRIGFVNKASEFTHKSVQSKIISDMSGSKRNDRLDLLVKGEMSLKPIQTDSEGKALAYAYHCMASRVPYTVAPNNAIVYTGFSASSPPLTGGSREDIGKILFPRSKDRSFTDSVAGNFGLFVSPIYRTAIYRCGSYFVIDEEGNWRKTHLNRATIPLNRWYGSLMHEAEYESKAFSHRGDIVFAPEAMERCYDVAAYVNSPIKVDVKIKHEEGLAIVSQLSNLDKFKLIGGVLGQSIADCDFYAGATSLRVNFKINDDVPFGYVNSQISCVFSSYDKVFKKEQDDESIVISWQNCLTSYGMYPSPYVAEHMTCSLSQETLDETVINILLLDGSLVTDARKRAVIEEGLFAGQFPSELSASYAACLLEAQDMNAHGFMPLRRSKNLHFDSPSSPNLIDFFRNVHILPKNIVLKEDAMFNEDGSIRRLHMDKSYTNHLGNDISPKFPAFKEILMQRAGGKICSSMLSLRPELESSLNSIRVFASNSYTHRYDKDIGIYKLIKTKKT